MKKYIVLTTVLIVFFIWLYAFKSKKNEVYKASFNGIIGSIKYDGKNQPTVIINKIEYKFNFAREKGELQIGDSLVKKENSIIVKQFRDGEYINEYQW